ncbi:MAG: hypothetical protein KDA96_24760, partial [Planctomycetaceae bacterium]|nr:hypothetical protein [Planctomycetaceae bacterium]
MRRNRYMTEVFWCSVTALALCLVPAGCARHQYRLAADQDAECLVSERTDAAWSLPDRTVTAASHSRMADLSDPDCGPLPPDDPAASVYMNRPYKSRGSRVWRERGSLPDVEFDHWKNFLPANEEGAVRLNRASSMELALLHSRDYQLQVESVYLQALPVSFQRFQYDTQWHGGLGVGMTNTGLNTSAQNRSLTLSESLGLGHRFASGGQFLADLSNAMVWEFTGGTTSANSVLSFQFLQPLMRRAFREVQLEPLTLAERSLLYSVRDFAFYRQDFYIDTVGTGGYLGLLAQAQAIRNEEANLESLRRNLEEHLALQSENMVGQFQVDQVYQDYEQGRLSLLQAQQSYATALDGFKIQLGLPPSLEMTLDAPELNQFELNNPELEQLMTDNEVAQLRLLQFSADELPSPDQLTEVLTEIERIRKEIPVLSREVHDELDRWRSRFEHLDLEPSGMEDDSVSGLIREQEFAERLAEALQEIDQEAPADTKAFEECQAALASGDLAAAWET